MAIPVLFEVLANLDFLVEGTPTTISVTDLRFIGYIDSILVQIAKSLENRYTVNEIREFLWQAHQTSERFPNHSFELLIKFGSVQLPLDNESKEHIQNHLDKLRRRYAMGNTSRKERLRSIVPVSVKQQKRHDNAASSVSSTCSYQNAQRSRVDRRNATTKSKPQSKRNRTTLKDKTTKSDNPVPTVEINRTVDDFPVSESSAMEIDPPVSETDKQLVELPTSVSEDMEPSHNSVYRKNPLDVETNLPLIISSEGNPLSIASELAFYKERCKKAEHECRILENQRRQIESMAELSKDMTKVLNQQVRKIKNQEKMLHDRANLERYLSFSNVPNAAPYSHRLVTQFQMLKDQIAAVLVMNGAYKPPIGELKGSSADLDSLLSNVFGKDTMSQPKAMTSAFPALSLYELIQALTGASIYSWVFGSKYRTDLMEVTPLLQEYRNLIATWCGPESLYNLDLAVHRSMIEDESFEKVTIPEMSKMLTDRLMKALQPLFNGKSRRKAIEKLRSSLSAVLQMAVKIRSESLVSAEHYGLIWPSVGSLFDGTKLETKSTGPMAVANVVRLPLCPGIQVYAKGKAMVDYRGLALSETSSPSPKYVIKALVLH